MPKYIQVDQEVLEFPDGMSDSEIQAALRKKFPPRAQPQASTGRSWGDALYDTGQDLNIAAASVIKGVGTAAGMLPGMSPDNAVTQFGESQIKQSEAAQSPELQAKRRALQQRTQAAEKTQGQWGAFKEQASGILSDPALLGSELTKLVPQMLPAAGAARTAAALGAGAKAVMAWAVGVGAGQQAADVAGEVYEEAIKQGHSPEVAKEKAMRAAMVSAPISVASQFAFGSGGRAVERFLTGQKTGLGTGIKTVTKAIAGEAGQETMEEVGGQMVQNIEAGAPITRGVGATAGAAAVLGALPGAVGGINDVREARAIEKDLTRPLAEIKARGEELGKLNREALMGPPEPKKKKMKQEQLNLELPLPEGAKLAENPGASTPMPNLIEDLEQQPMEQAGQTISQYGYTYTTISKTDSTSVEKVTSDDGVVDYILSKVENYDGTTWLSYTAVSGDAKIQVTDPGDGTYQLEISAEDNGEIVFQKNYDYLKDALDYLKAKYPGVVTQMDLQNYAVYPGEPKNATEKYKNKWGDTGAHTVVLEYNKQADGTYRIWSRTHPEITYFTTATSAPGTIGGTHYTAVIGNRYAELTRKSSNLYTGEIIDAQTQEVVEAFEGSYTDVAWMMHDMYPDFAMKLGLFFKNSDWDKKGMSDTEEGFYKLIDTTNKYGQEEEKNLTRLLNYLGDWDAVAIGLFTKTTKNSAGEDIPIHYALIQYPPELAANNPYGLLQIKSGSVYSNTQGPLEDLLEKAATYDWDVKAGLQDKTSFEKVMAKLQQLQDKKEKVLPVFTPKQWQPPEGAKPLKDFDAYVDWITKELRANRDEGWFAYATRKIGAHLASLPRFSEWYKKAYFKNKDGTPVIWTHGTAQDINVFIPKQANAIFMTRSPAFSKMFHGMSENWMVQNIDKVLTPPQYEAYIIAMRMALSEKLRADGVDPEKAKLSDFQAVAGYHAKTLEWLPSRQNSIPLVTNVQFVWDYENEADVNRVLDVLPSYLVGSAGSRYELKARLQRGDWTAIEKKEVRKALEDLGYEAFHMAEGGQKNLAVMDPTRVKSAIGNPDLFGDNPFLAMDEQVASEEDAPEDLTARVPVVTTLTDVLPIWETDTYKIEKLPIGTFVVFDKNGEQRVAEVVGTRYSIHESGKYTNYPRVREVSPEGIDPKKMPLFELHPDEIVMPFVVPVERVKKGFVKMYGDHKQWMAYALQMKITGKINEEQFGKIIAQLHTGAFISKDVPRYSTLKFPAEMVSADGIIDTKAMFKWLIEDPKMLEERPDLSALAALLANKVGDITFRVAMEEGKMLWGVVPEGSSKTDARMGFYHSGKHEITLGESGLSPSTIIHELVHAATHRYLLQYFEISGQKTSPRIPLEQMPPAIQAIYRQFLSARRAAGSYKIGKDKVNQWTLGPSWQYGLSNLTEFVAEATMNRTFQLELVKLAGEKEPKTWAEWMKSVWGTIIKSVGQMLGFSIPEQSLLANFLHTFSTLVEEQEKKNSTIAKELARIYNNPVYFREIAPSINYVLDGSVVAAGNVVENEKKGVKGKDEHSAKEKVIERTLGSTVDWIPEDPVLDDKLKEKILSEVDGADLRNWYAGGLQAAEVRGSTLIGTIYRLMDNASKRAERFNREFVKPLEKLWQPVLRDRRLTRLMHAIFTAELQAGTQFSEADLGRWLSPKEVNSYKAMRQVLDMAIDEQNDALLQVGLKPVTPLEAYFAARWSGPWRSVIRNADGKIVWVVAETTKGKAQKAVQWIKARNPGLTAEEVTAHHDSKGSENKLQAGYAELLKMLDPGDKDTQALREAWERAMVGVSENIMNQEKHFKQKTGVRGFRGDRPWADSYEDSRDFFLEQFKYLKAASEWAYMQTPLKTAKEILTDPEIVQMQKNNVTYSREYIRQYMGYGTSKWVDGMENAISEWLSWLPSGTTDMAIGSAKTLFYIAALGYNVGYMIYALLQPALGAGRHARLSVEGYKHNIGVTMVLSIGQGMAAVMNHYTRSLLRYSQGDVDKKALDKKMQELRELGDVGPDFQYYLDYIEDNGIIDMSPHTDIQDLYVPEGVQYARRILGATTGFVEAISRAMCFFSFVAHLQQSGKNLSKEEIAQMADEATKDVMADYRPNERAMIFQKAGLMGKALSTLQTFKFNWMSQVVKYTKMGVKEGKWRPFLAQMSVYLILAGALGSVGLDDLDDLWYFLLQGVDAQTWTEWKDKSPKSFLMRNLNGWLAYGAVAQATGTNLHTRGSLGDVLPWDPNRGVAENFANWVPFVGSTYSMGAAVVAGAREMMGKGNPDSNAAAIYKGLPAALKGPVDVKSDMFNYGDVSLSTADPELGVYRRSERDKAVRMFGLRSQEEYETMEGRYRHQRIDRATQKRLSDASDAFTASLLKGDDRATKYLEDYISLGGDPKNLVATGKLNEAVRRKALDYAQQLAVKARPGNLAAIQSFVSYFNNYAPNR